MQVRNFIYEDGGWVLDGMDTFDPGDAMTVVHDSFEHIDSTEGLEAELRAFGAMWWLRGETDWWCRFPRMDPRPEQVMYYDIATFIRENDFLIDNVGKRFKLGVDEENFLDVLRKLVEDALERDSQYLDKPVAKKVIQEAASTAMDWLRVGYRAARRKYPDNFAVADLMYDIYSRVYALNFRALEGSMLQLKYTLSGKFVEISLNGEPV
ncbi:hypothetical protein YH30_81 [Pseudomonas phage YH30]|uniref:Uncharacterized protein n=1 Tax=Pseudomonas phage YH30 TaxID=1636189 RepID=A0A0E3XDC2_9CAUD|nr:hypothetical protein YH30_81 [Pseudomonas phage YH30]AKC04823.1 hypothetical protein YH30_81 [Pseudomonas phage YH30]